MSVKSNVVCTVSIGVPRKFHENSSVNLLCERVSNRVIDFVLGSIKLVLLVCNVFLMLTLEVQLRKFALSL